jgi:hypothetical protein
MSQPISFCTVSKAALGDEKAFQFLVEAMEYNLAWGAYTIFHCECDPPCPRPTVEQTAAFDKRLQDALEARRKERAKTAKPVGNFDKCIFPVIKSTGPVPPVNEIMDCRQGLCHKVVHDKATGFLHQPDDDGPYDVDGLMYCGRCHHAMQGA